MKNDISCVKMFRYGFWAGAGYIAAKVTLTAIVAKITLSKAKKTAKKAGTKIAEEFIKSYDAAMIDKIGAAYDNLDLETKLKLSDLMINSMTDTVDKAADNIGVKEESKEEK